MRIVFCSIKEIRVLDWIHVEMILAIGRGFRCGNGLDEWREMWSALCPKD
jgi:hypothetical protein